MKKSKILTILMVLVLMFSLVACSTTKNNDKSQSNNTADISNLMESEPSNLDDATALYQKLMQKENEIFSSNSQLWEKVFMSANKDTPMIEDGTNYGDFLLNTIENGKDKFTADELKILKDGANQIKEIEGKLTILEQKYPGCGSKPSGPMVLSASSHIRDISDGRYNAVIDIKPALSYEQLEKRLQRDFDENHNKDVSNSFTKLLPKKLVVPVLKRWGIPFDKKCNSVTKEERRTLCELLKAFTVEISGFRPIEEAIITSGGVKTTEINPKTMESRLVKGLYFAGEVIDCDAYTGGFNLQIAWSTGNLAGESAAY